jgi:hypothetical protein
MNWMQIRIENVAQVHFSAQLRRLELNSPVLHCPWMHEHDSRCRSAVADSVTRKIKFPRPKFG